MADAFLEQKQPQNFPFSLTEQVAVVLGEESRTPDHKIIWIW